MRVRLTHIDGKLPNLALMKLAHFHRAAGDEVVFTRAIARGLMEPDYDRVYGSAIFGFSAARVRLFKEQWPDAIVGGTGSGDDVTVEQIIGDQPEAYDYSIYPDFEWSLGFTQRGCRLKCKFCVVPKKEGKPRSVNSIPEIWREGTAKRVILLDNDFFGQPEEQWRARIAEMEGFQISLNQGINVRMITDEAAAALAQIHYMDWKFTARRLYTAWDNLKDEKVFFRGIDRLQKAGIPPTHLMVYMLIGFDPSETMERIKYRFYRMADLGIRPYPMVFDPARADLKRFQRWVTQRHYKYCEFEDYDQPGYRRGRFDERQPDFLKSQGT